MKLMVKKLVLLLFLLGIGTVFPAAAGAQVLSNNSGSGNAPWTIQGEPSVVITGFDLNSLGIQRPAIIDKISIVVQTPVAGSAVTAVVYQDANGGSPADATLAGSEQFNITQAGTFTATFTTPVTVTQPVVWVGFYLPVGFTFLADTSGSSVLTYWGWTPGGTLDLAKLSAAQVLGPGDGTAPVNLAMSGIARITAEITGAGGTTGTQTAAQSNVDMGVMSYYVGCDNLSHDTADEYISYGDAINLHCTTAATYLSPPAPAGYTQRGALYDVIAFKDNGNVEKDFILAITHCIRPAAEDIDKAVIGLAYGQPRTWQLLTTQRFGDLICAEVRHSGNITYFVH